MKNFVLTLILTAALIGLFSWMDYRQPMAMGNGSGTKQKGDSGLILPGGGNEMANANFVTDNKVGDKKEPTAEKISTVQKESKAESEEITQELKEKHNMNDIVLSFWHGVATVLIGETVALMVAVAWMKIRGGK